MTAPQQAQARLEESLSISGKVGYTWHIGLSLFFLGLRALLQGDVAAPVAERASGPLQIDWGWGCSVEVLVGLLALSLLRVPTQREIWHETRLSDVCESLCLL